MKLVEPCADVDSSLKKVFVMSPSQYVSVAQEQGFCPKRLTLVNQHFESYVDDGRLPGFTVSVARKGQLVHHHTYGMADIEAGTATQDHTIYRIYSMTKPVTSVALLMLMEQGRLQLTDLVSDYIPSFAQTKVWRSGSTVKPVLEGQTEPIRIWHLLTHMSGLTYGFFYAHAVDELYRKDGLEFGARGAKNLAEVCDRYAALPLLFQAGTSWNYSVATDVVGRIVEIISGQTLDAFFTTHIFQPLKMYDTSFSVGTDKAKRVAALYGVGESGKGLRRLNVLGNDAFKTPSYHSGGGGLLSTHDDYSRFLKMLENRGELEGVRLLSPSTVALMTMNHLPRQQDVASFGTNVGEEISYEGLGFGLGVSVVIDQAKTRSSCPVGTYGWGGVASTVFWVDPVNQITAQFYTQLLPSSTYPIRPFLRQLVYQALVRE